MKNDKELKQPRPVTLYEIKKIYRYIQQHDLHRAAIALIDRKRDELREAKR